jgi:hypothetical protein
MPKTAFPIFLTTFLLLSGTRDAAAQQPTLFQELGLFFTSSTSNHVELPSPVGFGAFARWGFADAWLFRLSYHRSKDETNKVGTVCDQYSQRINCRQEPTNTRVTFSGLRGAFSRAVRLGHWGELGLGAGLSFNHVDPEAKALTGWHADMLVPNAGQIGYLATASVAVSPFQGMPILLVGAFTGHWVNFRGCSAEDPPQYDPFCGLGVLKEIEAGFSYTF